MMRDAESRNIRVCLATLPPQRAGGARSRDVVAGLIPGFTDQVRALAASHNAVLVDVYAGMKDDLSLIGVDDLHPTARGYEAMASIYRDAIAKAFEARGDERLWRAGRFRDHPVAIDPIDRHGLVAQEHPHCRDRRGLVVYSAAS